MEDDGIDPISFLDELMEKFGDLKLSEMIRIYKIAADAIHILETEDLDRDLQ